MMEDLLKKEQEEVELQKLPQDLYLTLLNRIGGLKNKIELKDGLEKRVLKEEMKTLKNCFSELVTIRLEKMLKHQNRNLMPEEEKVFKEISELIKKYKKTLFAGSIPRRLKVRTKKDLPEIIGPDLRAYGPFKKGENIELPIEIGILLIKSNQCIKVKENEDAKKN
ncbi:MAG: hypothetical protein U9N35_07490 [Euryarchaeota archaeon]|nr:hypothetical protein [Euryarchaeota archaeon]